MPENELIVHQPISPATSTPLAQAFMSLENDLRSAAEQALVVAIGEDNDYTVVERQAMVTIETLRLVNGLDLSALILREKIITEIEHGNYVTIHPEGYRSLKDMAAKQGLSAAQLSKTLNLVRVIFPYLREHLDMNIALAFESVGISKFTEMLPYLRQLITGEESSSPQVRNTVSNMLDDTVATAHAAGNEIDEAEQIRLTIDTLMTDGVLLNARQLRTRLRPERTDPVQVTVINGPQGGRMIISQVSEDQWTMLERKMGGSAEYMNVNLSDNVQERSEALTSIVEIRTLTQLMEA